MNTKLSRILAITVLVTIFFGAVCEARPQQKPTINIVSVNPVGQVAPGSNIEVKFNSSQIRDKEVQVILRYYIGPGNEVPVSAVAIVIPKNGIYRANFLITQFMPAGLYRVVVAETTPGKEWNFVETDLIIQVLHGDVFP